jgi:hypothetical protein
MKLNEEDDGLTFDNGRECYAHAGIIGIDNSLHIFYGYDGGLPGDLTPGERVELADYMINLWEKFKKNV